MKLPFERKYLDHYGRGRGRIQKDLQLNPHHTTVRRASGVRKATDAFNPNPVCFAPARIRTVGTYVSIAQLLEVEVYNYWYTNICDFILMPAAPSTSSAHSPFQVK